jgi:outer membrane protein TolC
MRESWAVVSVIVAGLGLAPVVAQAEGEPSVSLTTLIEAARRHHPTLAREPLLSQSLELTKAELNRAYWPQLTLGGRATWQSAVTSVVLPIPGVGVAPLSKDQYRATLDLQQNLWDGGVASEQKQLAQARSVVEREKVKLDWHQLRHRILQLYFAGVVQQDLEAQGELLQGHLGVVVEKAQVSLKSGVLTERDVVLAQAKQLEARQAMVEASAQLAGVRRSLEELTGATIPRAAVLATPAASCAPAEAHTPASALHRPELRLLDAQARVLDAQEQLDEAADLPRLGAFATAGYGRPGLNMLDDSFQPYFIGGVQLSVPLTYLYTGTWQNGRDQLTVQRSLVAREREAVVKQVELELQAQATELERLDAVIALDDELISLRERARKQTDLQLQLGTASMTDLLDDLAQEDQARTRRAVHRAQHELTCRQLELIRGDL